MSEHDLFGESPSQRKSSSSNREGRVRVQRAERRQVEFRPSCLDDALPEEHRARVLWDAVEELDLSRFYEDVAAREGSAGRPAIDPQILVSLWLYATSEGVGSARELARLCETHDAYRWLCGGVSVNHHTLSDFRVNKGQALDELMTQVLGLLMHDGIVRLRRVAQDGMKVRANAGAASFRRQRSLKECFRQAREQIRQARKQLDSEGGSATKRMSAARLKVAQDRMNRVKKAMRRVEELRQIKTNEKEEVRASTTDPECLVMRMADGGYRPAYNLQFATDVEGRSIVGVQVTNKGNDQSQMEPMLAEIGRRTEQLPKEYLVDGGFVKLESIEKAAACGVKVFSPIQEARRKDIDATKPKKNDGPGVAAWRQRMGTARAQEIYKDRAATAERTNADLKTWRGLDSLPVRGIGKVLCVVLWSAITFNLMRWAEYAT